jgi:hypothetical protein
MSIRFSTGGNSKNQHWRGYIGGDMSPVCFRFVFRHHLFSTTWPALFLALFFQQERVFNNFSALFLGLFRFVFSPDLLFSATSPVCFSK